LELSLPPQLEEFVRAQVRTGKYLDEQDVVRDALRQMRSLVRAAEDPTLAGLVRDALGIANQAQKDVTSLLQSADKDQSVFGEVTRQASAVASAALDQVRKVPGARELDRLVRAPLDGVTMAAKQGELNAKAMRANLETTAKALGLLTAVLERVNSASRTVNSVISPPEKPEKPEKPRNGA
jgi:putative addiction module CopG family antidote